MNEGNNIHGICLHLLQTVSRRWTCQNTTNHSFLYKAHAHAKTITDENRAQNKKTQNKKQIDIRALYSTLTACATSTVWIKLQCGIIDNTTSTCSPSALSTHRPSALLPAQRAPITNKKISDDTRPPSPSPFSLTLPASVFPLDPPRRTATRPPPGKYGGFHSYQAFRFGG